jgi:hypothetical protein
MAGVGILFCAPVGAALASIGRSSGRAYGFEEDPLPGCGMRPKDIAANYWRDEGHAPFSNPKDAVPAARRLHGHLLPD